MGAGPVVNWLWKSASAFPKRSATPLVASTVIVEEAGSPYGFKVTTLLSADILIPTPPGGATPFTSRPKLFAGTVLGFKDFEKVSVTGVFKATPVVAFAGVTNVTVGAAVSVPVPVENVLEYEVLAFPDKSSSPLELTWSTTVAFAGRGDTGANVRTVPVPSIA